ncbi:MAG: hypothetical protein EOP13_20955 [Pseudomonas sp.]|nr:MAG: hypothetical protein EOP13_20955 [Pseudomonas sp.]
MFLILEQISVEVYPSTGRGATLKALKRRYGSSPGVSARLKRLSRGRCPDAGTRTALSGLTGCGVLFCAPQPVQCRLLHNMRCAL